MIDLKRCKRKLKNIHLMPKGYYMFLQNNFTIRAWADIKKPLMDQMFKTTDLYVECLKRGKINESK